jgi:hypothetical protein
MVFGIKSLIGFTCLFDCVDLLQKSCMVQVFIDIGKMLKKSFFYHPEHSEGTVIY